MSFVPYNVNQSERETGTGSKDHIFIVWPNSALNEFRSYKSKDFAMPLRSLVHCMVRYVKAIQLGVHSDHISKPRTLAGPQICSCQ